MQWVRTKLGEWEDKGTWLVDFEPSGSWCEVFFSLRFCPWPFSFSDGVERCLVARETKTGGMVDTNGKAFERLKKRRKLAGLLPVVGVLVVLVGACSSIVYVKAGFDQYGYNYNARLFNGWYGYYDKVLDGGLVPGTGDAMLVMKWSEDWTPMAEEPIGAWCTNHFKWYSNDYDEDTWYGWETRDKWVDSNGPFIWSLVGDWSIHVDYLGGTYMHNMIVTDQTDEGVLAGTGSSPVDQVTWQMTGLINGDHISFEMAWDYDGSSYVGTVVGIIAEDGTISGTWSSNANQAGLWWSVSGACTKIYEGVAAYKITEFLKIQKVGDDPIAWALYEQGGAYDAQWGTYSDGVPKYVVYQDTVDVFDTATKALVAHYDFCNASPKGLGQAIF
jgi:hypothetical protein